MKENCKLAPYMKGSCALVPYKRGVRSRRVLCKLVPCRCWVLDKNGLYKKVSCKLAPYMKGSCMLVPCK